MERSYTCLPDEYLDEMETLTDEEYGRLVRALQHYHITGETPVLEGNEKHFIKRVLNREDRYKENFDGLEKRLKERAEKAANARWSKAKDTNGCISIPEHTSSIHTDSYTDSNTNIKKGNAPTPIATQPIIDTWNSTCVSHPKVKAATDQRKRRIKLLLTKWKEDEIRQVFVMTEESDFLKGQNDRGWIADFDWVINPTNFAKVMEGNYANHKPAKKNKFNNIEQRTDYEDGDELIAWRNICKTKGKS